MFNVWNLDIIIVREWGMFKGLWEKGKRNSLKLESHCGTDFFKRKFTYLWAESMRTFLLWVLGGFG